MLNIAICEDDSKAIRLITLLLKTYVQQHPDYTYSVQAFPSATALLEYVDKNGAFDLYFMDIIMPDISGIDAAHFLNRKGNHGVLIFLTSSKDFALEAFRVGAIQYLIKPIDEKELFAAVDKALSFLKKNASKSIFVSTVRGKENLPLSSIVYVECRNHILTYHLSDGVALLGRTIRTSFEVAMEPLLSERNFIHPHKSFIINADFVRSLNSQSFLMTDGTQIPITKSRYTQARTKYLHYFDLFPGT